MRAYNLEGYKEFASEHYRYYCKPGSLAESEIEMIKQVQEESYSRIVRFLDVEPDFPIRYILCESSEEVGRAYGDDEPCNGFADLPDTVFAVYSDHVKCIGPHEDMHLMAALLARPESVFLREGLAMYMDEKWWGRANTLWVKDLLEQQKYPGIVKLFDNEQFWEYPDEITYPLAGAFTMWLVETLGRKTYLEKVYITGPQTSEMVENAVGTSIEQIDQRFCKWIQQQFE